MRMLRDSAAISKHVLPHATAYLFAVPLVCISQYIRIGLEPYAKQDEGQALGLELNLGLAAEAQTHPVCGIMHVLSGCTVIVLCCCRRC